MGGSSSKASQKIRQEKNTLIVNENELNILNENLNSMVSNTIMEDAKGCSANITQLQDIEFEGIKIGGDWNMTTDQAQDSAITFDCVNATETRNNISNSMVDEMMNKLSTSTSADIVSKMELDAQNKAESGALTFGKDTEASSDIEAIENYEYRTQNKQNIENIVKNSVEANFTSNTVQECIASVNQSQNQNFKNIEVEGDAFLVLGQTQSAELIANCAQSSEAVNGIINDVKKNLGLETSSEMEVKQETDSSVSAENSSKNKGAAEEVGDAVSGMIDSLFGGFTGLFGEFGKILPSLISLAVIVVFIYFFIIKGGGGGGGNMMPQQMMSQQMMPQQMMPQQMMSQMMQPQPNYGYLPSPMTPQGYMR